MDAEGVQFEEENEKQKKTIQLLWYLIILPCNSSQYPIVPNLQIVYYKPYNVTYQSLEISQQFPFYRRDCCSKIDFLHLWHFGKIPPEE